jgi:hypothetical protein
MRLRATRLTAASNPRRRLLDPARLYQTAGRVGVCYTSDTGGVSWDDLIAENMRAIAAGTPHLAPLTHDSAGTVPVVYPIAAGQGMGFLRDRSAGSALGAELVTNGTFDDATGWTAGTGWSIGSGVATKTAGTASNLDRSITLVAGRAYQLRSSVTRTAGTLTAQFVGGTTVSGIARSTSGEFVQTIFAATGNVTLRINADAAFAGTIDNISVQELPGFPLTQPTLSARGEFSRRYNKLLATVTLSTQSVTTIATTYRLLFSGAGTVTLSGAATGTLSAGSHTITATAGTLTLTVSGVVTDADLRFSADAHIGKPYQRVTTASDYDEEGYPTYLRRQTDDWARAFAVNPNGATKALAFWAGQKMSDAATGMCIETGTVVSITNGSLAVRAPANVGANYYSESRGTLLSTAITPGSQYPAPHRALLSLRTDIGADIHVLRVNGQQVASSTADQGTGTYLTYDLFEGARAGTSLFANTRSYTPPMLMFIQPADPGPTDSEIARLEAKFKRAAGVL